MIVGTAVRTLQIDDEFEGFDEGQVFSLTDGSLWIQAEYKYAYHYAFMPRVTLLSGNDGRIYLQVDGMAESVAVRQLSNVVRSRISGAFSGWSGDTEYQLQNRQIWKQSRYKYKYKYKYAPRVLVYRDGGRYHMHVAGTTAEVTRLK